MSALYKKVCKSLLNEEQGSNICCLCLEPAGEEASHISDEISYKFEKYGYVELSKVLIEILGEQYLEVTSVLHRVCKECTSEALSSFRFIAKCRKNADSLSIVVDSLNACFENTTDEVDSCKSLYASINIDDNTIEQFYDSQTYSLPLKTALQRFQYIAFGVIEKESAYLKLEDPIEKPKARDFSTIFIKTHELIHDPSKPEEYKCKMCLKIYPTSGSLRQHFFAHHFKKEYKCPQCPKSFGTNGILQTHISQTHQFVQCNECGKKLLNRTSSLKRHLAIHNQSSKTCHRCGRIYKKAVDFERHVAQETCIVPSRMPGNFTCDNCGYTCHYKHQLLAHIKYEHTDAPGFGCSYCGRKCYSQSALKIHLLKHTGEKNFVCAQCGGKYVTRQSLINHMRLHTGERPYHCKYCDQSFLSASRRTEHVERHHIGASFECDLCDAKYNAKRSLVKHRKRHFENDA